MVGMLGGCCCSPIGDCPEWTEPGVIQCGTSSVTHAWGKLYRRQRDDQFPPTVAQMTITDPPVDWKLAPVGGGFYFANAIQGWWSMQNHPGGYRYSSATTNTYQIAMYFILQMTSIGTTNNYQYQASGLFSLRGRNSASNILNSLGTTPFFSWQALQTGTAPSGWLLSATHWGISITSPLYNNPAQALIAYQTVFASIIMRATKDSGGITFRLELPNTFCEKRNVTENNGVCSWLGNYNETPQATACLDP